MAGAANSYDADWEDDSGNNEEINDIGLDKVGDHVEQWIFDSDKDVSNLGLNEGDTSLVSTNPSLPASPLFLYKDNLASDHYIEKAEGDGVSEGVGDRTEYE